ncbi:hypothetical protein SAMN04515673_103272 [Poseidonocella sedimentorum]|uniref:Uncharacterized protein n=1 Tax=Poseidonocella sedimentorum TaxID=871652 RepID=A0A1I6DHK4_9RHOB|nr:hypothetical protein SAMN04515673_103272 [Poseidonocella sedimentorum]
MAAALAGLSAAAGAACPPVADRSGELARLFAAVRAAPDADAAAPLTRGIWAIWAAAPDATAQEILDRGMRRREGYDFPGAVREFDRLVAYCPDYAEGYNQRAFARYLQGDYAVALTDLDAALARAPEHTGALTGKALTLIGLGRHADASPVLRAALALNPWLPERGLLPMLDAAEGAGLGAGVEL